MSGEWTVWETDVQRLIIEADEWADMPYDDGGYPLIRIVRCRHCQGMQAQQITEVTEYRLPDDICSSLHYFTSNEWRTARDGRDLWERYVRIWHDVTDIDVIDDVVAINPVEWRESVGAPREETVTADEWRAYVNGEVYVALLQERVKWTSDRGETRHEWETVDSVGGFYGSEWAESGALENFPAPELVTS